MRDSFLSFQTHVLLAVVDVLDTEAAALNQDPDFMPQVRDNVGGSQISYLMDRRLIDETDDVQYGRKYKVDEKAEPTFTTVAELQIGAAHLSKETLDKYYKGPGGNASAATQGEVRVIERGFNLISDCITLDTPRYYDEPIKGESDLVCFTVRVEASQTAGVVYATASWFRVDRSKKLVGGIHPVVEIVTTQCMPIVGPRGGVKQACKASGYGASPVADYQYGYCTHGAANLMILRNLFRPAGYDQENSPTALSCWWNEVGLNADYFNPTHPVFRIMCRQPNANRAYERKRNLACLRSEYPRGQYNPFMPSMWEILQDFDDPQRVALRHKFFDVSNCLYNSRPVRTHDSDGNLLSYHPSRQGPAPGQVLMTMQEATYGCDFSLKDRDAADAAFLESRGKESKAQTSPPLVVESDSLQEGTEEEGDKVDSVDNPAESVPQVTDWEVLARTAITNPYAEQFALARQQTETARRRQVTALRHKKKWKTLKHYQAQPPVRNSERLKKRQKKTKE